MLTEPITSDDIGKRFKMRDGTPETIIGLTGEVQFSERTEYSPEGGAEEGYRWQGASGATYTSDGRHHISKEDCFDLVARLDAPARVPPSSPSGPDHRIIDAVSVALGGQIGRDDDVDRLRAQLKPTDGDHARVACEIAVAFIRWAQQLKAELTALRAGQGAES